MTNGLKDLLYSERGAFCLLALLVAAALAALGRIDGTVWIDFAKYLAGALLASKTVTSAVEIHATKAPRVPRAKVVKEAVKESAPPA